MFVMHFKLNKWTFYMYQACLVNSKSTYKLFKRFLVQESVEKNN